MNEWKIATIMSLIVNLFMMGLLVVAVFYVKDLVDKKNTEISSLNSKITTLTTETAVVTAKTNEESTEEVQIAEASTEEKVEPLVIEKPVEQAMTKPAQEPVTKVATKKEPNFAPYVDELVYDINQVLFHLDGIPQDEVDNATLRTIYEEAYQEADILLNKIYGILKKELPTDQFSTLQTEQRSWLQKLTNSKNSRLGMGGSSAGIDVAEIMFDETLMRCDYFMRTYMGITNY